VVHLELVVSHRGQVRVVELPLRGVVGIGRDEEQAIRIDDPSVSRRHATLTIEASDSAVVEDEGSANGTRVVRGEEGTPGAVSSAAKTSRSTVIVSGPTEVMAGDSICLGTAVLRLRKAVVVDASPMAALDRMIAQVAPSPIRVLLLGETGVGKEVVAERIHAASARAAHSLVKVHCAALSETLLESELFGHEKGAFTGAVHARVGLIEAAHKGTLFLDEIGEMSLSTQVKLLRVLEDGKVQPVGSTVTRQIDARIVSATHRELASDVKQGRFRQDLYFRINGITLRIPPLRDRKSEIVPIAILLLARAAEQYGRRAPVLEEAARARLLAHEWPGNVRELRQAMERALALATGDSIGARELVLDEPPPSVGASRRGGGTLREDLEALERRRIEEALDACGGNQSQAAERLGMPRRTLVERLRSWGMTASRSKRSRS
jgi:DNA-binding NtrC family response regulator